MPARIRPQLMGALVDQLVRGVVAVQPLEVALGDGVAQTRRPADPAHAGRDEQLTVLEGLEVDQPEALGPQARGELGPGDVLRRLLEQGVEHRHAPDLGSRQVEPGVAQVEVVADAAVGALGQEDPIRPHVERHAGAAAQVEGVAQPDLSGGSAAGVRSALS